MRAAERDGDEWQVRGRGADRGHTDGGLVARVEQARRPADVAPIRVWREHERPRRHVADTLCPQHRIRRGRRVEQCRVGAASEERTARAGAALRERAHRSVQRAAEHSVNGGPEEARHTLQLVGAKDRSDDGERRKRAAKDHGMGPFARPRHAGCRPPEFRPALTPMASQRASCSLGPICRGMRHGWGLPPSEREDAAAVRI